MLNEWVDRGTLRRVYAVEDPFADVHGAAVGGRSPRLLLRDTLGDWMKAHDPRSRVFAVGGKDRSAILLGGLFPDGVFWYEAKAGGFTTSEYYAPEGTPDWLRAFHADGWLERLPQAWTYPSVASLRPDDDPRESDRYGRASPHPLRVGGRERFFENLPRTPYLDAFTLRLARQVVEHNDLGRGPAPDLVCIALAATDYVGHMYGPWSQEMRDTLLRLDAGLAEFFAFLEARGAPFAVVLASDHGVLPLPQVRRVDAAKAMAELMAEVRARHAGAFAFSFTQITVDRRAGRFEEVVAGIAALLRARGDAAAVVDAAMLAGKGGGDALLELARRSRRPDRGGDLLFVPAESVLFTTHPTGTSHGSPWPYDREVPLLYWGSGIAAGEAPQQARSIDIAPTLARILGLRAPDDLDGVPLDLAAAR